MGPYRFGITLSFGTGINAFDPFSILIQSAYIPEFQSVRIP